MNLKKLTVALDMYGCPNRCKHCWVGHSPNGKLSESDLIYVAQSFRPFAEKMEIFDWYREPDFKENYKRLWQLRTELSDFVTPHFELISVFRLVRDENYVKWLASLGLKYAQLTLFGGEATTDFYTGRRGAYKEILHAMDILIDNGISPRLQIFANKSNIDELPLIANLIESNNYAKRCETFGGKFACFVHQGSCDGENEKLYNVRVTPEDLTKIPKQLADYTLKYFGADNLSVIFGQTERELYAELIADNSVHNFVDGEPTFYVDKNFDVYPNISTPTPFWRLGNLKADGVSKILNKYLQNESIAQKVGARVPIKEIVKVAGNSESMRFFDKNDYIIYIINQYCKMYGGADIV